MNSKLLVISMLSFINLKAERLTPDENGMRSIQCGKEKLPTYPAQLTQSEVDSTSWLVKVSPITSFFQKQHTSIGSFISPRHIITSAQVIAEPHVQDMEKWVMDGEDVNLSVGCHPDDVIEFMARIAGISNILEVPEKHVLNLNIASLNCERRNRTGDCGTSIYTPKKAWILGVCPVYNYFVKYAPLVIEVEGSGPSFGCLADMTVPEAGVGQEYHLYGLEVAGEYKLLHYVKTNLSNIPSNNPEFLVLTSPGHNNNRGGPMIGEVDGRQYIYGIRAGVMGKQNNEKLVEFYNIRRDFYGKQICTVSGVCPVQPGEYTEGTTVAAITTILDSTTAPTSTTHSPITTSATGTIPNVTTSSPSTLRVTVPSNSTEPPNDQPPELESELEKEPNDNDEYEEEETDFHVDEDFFNGKKKWGLELIFVLVFWVL